MPSWASLLAATLLRRWGGARSRLLQGMTCHRQTHTVCRQAEYTTGSCLRSNIAEALGRCKGPPFAGDSAEAAAARDDFIDHKLLTHCNDAGDQGWCGSPLPQALPITRMSGCRIRLPIVCCDTACIVW